MVYWCNGIMGLNVIRALIFFVAGLAMIVFPNDVYRFQVYLVSKFGIKCDLKRDRKFYFYVGVLFVVIGLVLM